MTRKTSKFLTQALLLLIVAAIALFNKCSGTKGKSHSQSSDSTRIEEAKAIADEIIIRRDNYIISYNQTMLNPNYVGWELTAEETIGELPREEKFSPDPALPENLRIDTYEYSNSGFDRGHMAPAADMKFSPKAMEESFYMSNVCPQTHKLNAGGWLVIEERCRKWAKQEGKIYIICGPIYEQNTPKFIGKNVQIRVPDAFFKVVIAPNSEKPKGIGFYFLNNTETQAWRNAARTIDEIEQLTGYDFFHILPDELENKIESSFNIKEW